MRLMVHHPYDARRAAKKGFDLGIREDTRRCIKVRGTRNSRVAPSVVLLLAEAGRLEVW